MHLDRQDLTPSSDDVNVLGQQHIPIIVFISYLLSLILTTKIKEEINCKNQETPRKVHYNSIDFSLNQKVLIGGTWHPRLEKAAGFLDFVKLWLNSKTNLCEK